MECMDNVNWGNCLWFEGGGEKKNVISGMISGLLVSSLKNIFINKVQLRLIFFVISSLQ